MKVKSKLLAALAAVFLIVAFACPSSIAKDTLASRKAKLNNWALGFINRYQSCKFGKVVKLGNPALFTEAVNYDGLQVVFDSSLGDMGKFYPPEALVFGKTGLRNPHIYIKSPEGLGPNVTNWHELVHAIIYFKGWRKQPCLGALANETARGNREEAYTWLCEERIGWLNQVKQFETKYKKVEIEKDPVKRQKGIVLLKKKWKILKRRYKSNKLSKGPAKYGGTVISSACVKQFDNLLGFKINSRKIRKLYPLLDSLAGTKWTTTVYWKSKSGPKKYSVTVLDDNPQKFTIRVLGSSPGDKPRKFYGKKVGKVLDFVGTKPFKDYQGVRKISRFPVHVKLNTDYTRVTGWTLKGKIPVKGKIIE